MTTVERLRALLAGASEAPWQWLDSGGETLEYDELQDGRGEMVAAGFRDDLGDRDGYVALTDGRLCAETRNALPALLDEREALRAALVEALGELHGDPNGYHHCRWCSGVDSHTDYCAWVARNERIAGIREAARAALDRLDGAS